MLLQIEFMKGPKNVGQNFIQNNYINNDLHNVQVVKMKIHSKIIKQMEQILYKLKKIQILQLNINFYYQEKK